MNITVYVETITRSIIVLPKDFGTVDVEPEPDASDAANTQFRNAVWACTKRSRGKKCGRVAL